MKRITIFIMLLITVITAKAQLQSPADFLGYELGDKFTHHHRVVDYYNHVAMQSGMVKVEEYGKSYEGRSLLLAYVSSEANMGKLEQIRTDNLKRTGQLQGSPTTRVGIVWLSYNVHGNEANSTEASMITLYKLITEKQDWLTNTLVIIDPCINPDGRERYVNFYDQVGQVPFNPDPQSAEHNEPWPGGRYNHYLFDLNRDWAWQTQIESRERIEEYNKWMPHVHVDFHEQGYNSPYYFAPAAKPYHEMITSWQREFQHMIGRNHAKYFDENNWFYFTRQRFDLLYPSYGDTYPTYNGSIGMTYEQAGSGRAGLGIIKNEGDTLTLLDRLTHHTVAGLSTVEVAAKNSDKMLNEFSKFFDTPVTSKYKSFVLKSDNQDKINDLKAWLDMNGVLYGKASNVKGLKGYNYSSKRTEAFMVNPNDLVVSVNQPKGVLANILFEPQTKIEDSLTYDITAWSVPYFYGMDAYATSTLLNVNTTSSGAAKTEAEAPESTYAFFIRWNSFDDARLLARLFNKDVKVRFSTREIKVDGKVFKPGTLIITKSDNQHIKDFEKLVTGCTTAFNQDFYAIKTGFMDEGPDLGSSEVSFIQKPKVAMLRGENVSVSNYGANWFYLERQLGYPFSALNTENFSRIDLDEYDVLILQEGWYSDFRKAQMEKLMSWVNSGGKLIVIGSAINKFADSDYASISRFNSEEEKKKFEEADEKKEEESKLLPYDQGRREYARYSIPGAIFKVTLDNTHPLAFGYGKYFYTLKRSSSRYGYLDSQNVGIIKSSNDYMSGFAGEYVLDEVGKSLVLGVENSGRGEIVYFVDNPIFRGFWHDYKLMLANAIFFVGQD